MSGLVKDVGESVGRSEGAIRCGLFMKVSGGLRWRTVSRDTTAVGAEARAVESGMEGWLGRVKVRAPGGELPAVVTENLSTISMGVEHFGQRKQVGWVGEEVAADGCGMGWSASNR